MVSVNVERYGRTILVERMPSLKTKFTIYLPVSSDLDIETRIETKTFAKGAEHILFVDDEPPIARMEGKIIENPSSQLSGDKQNQQL